MYSTGTSSSLLNEVEQVQYATGSTIAVGERVNGFELIVCDGHSHERIVGFLVVEETLPVGQQIAQSRLAVRRRIDNLASRPIRQRRPRTRRTSFATPRIVRQISIAVRVVSGRFASD